MKLISAFIFALALFFSAASGARADGFVINLYYNTAAKTLSLNKSVKSVSRDQNADTSIVEFSKDEAVGLYILKLYDAKGIEFSSSQFNKKDGAFQLIIPYFSIAAQLKVVEKSTEKELISADLKEFMTCNGNGKCEADLGETDLNCMGDCEASTSKSSTVTDTSASTKIIPLAEKVAAETDKSQASSVWQKIVSFFSNLF